MPPLIVIVGATAVGKTALSLDLAARFDGEIVNADSRSFYRGMDIGTAKPSAGERARVRHHLIDILDPADDVSLALFQDLATAVIADIGERGRLPFLVGGTPQYINAVVEGWQIPRVEPDPAFRARMQDLAEREGPGAVLGRLRAVDPASADRAGANLRRAIRALEVYEATGRPMSEQQGKGPAPYHALELELWRPREDLHRRIDERVDRQVADGLFDEIRALLHRGVPTDARSFGSIGYRQALPHVLGDATADEVIQRIRYDTHRLVRHQQTWWRKNPRLVRIDLTQPGAGQQAADAVARHLASPAIPDRYTGN
jgi:tRNA dimethylallyltransferase